MKCVWFIVETSLQCLHCILVTVKAISDTAQHLVPRPLPARPRNSIWRQAKEWSLNEIYILYFLLLFLTFLFFLVGRHYILKCQVSYSLSEKRFYDRIFPKQLVICTDTDGIQK